PCLRWPLDHVFHGREFSLVNMRRLDYFGSDYFPIYIKLEYVPGLSEDQQPDEKNDGDHDGARQKVEEATDNVVTEQVDEK
ncbi:MAG: endonuclease, partial [Gammaproteobacteria bacterium]|nr:endonuclease [Gammaproteobacteria bacterium]